MIRLLATSGRGPAECRIALANAIDKLAYEAEMAELDCNVAWGPAPDRQGPASAVIVIDGDGAAAFARRWVGSILWTATSPLRPHHKRKNWFIGIAELPAPVQAASNALAPGDIRYEAFRAGGPGGQHQNKTESAVRAVHLPTGLAAVARDGRSQHRNKELARGRLAELIRMADELKRNGDRALIQSGHDKLERGNPVRRFQGPDFMPV